MKVLIVICGLVAVASAAFDVRCPKPSGFGLCVMSCDPSGDSCGEGKLCCSNGCGTGCVDIPNNKTKCNIVNCFVNPCRFAKCTGASDAICKANYCGGCNYEFYRKDGTKLTDADCNPIVEKNKCGPVCMIYCPLGNVMVNGCPTCKCNPPPKPDV